MAVQPIFGEHTISQLTMMFKHRQINLEPGFQRQSVWTNADRRRLIQSLAEGYPLPSIFFYKRVDKRGRLIYDVIDGKQRLETILMFMKVGRFRSDWFEVRLNLGEGLDWYDWSWICKHLPHIRSRFESTQIQAVEVTGELSEIIELFVRINSTGKRLTSSEKRHARYYTSRFLQEAESLGSKYDKYVRDQRILSPNQIKRMKGTELFAELLMSIQNGSPIDKKVSLDRAIGNDAINGNTLARLSREFIGTMNLVKRMFPKLKHTRFRNTVEFYTLFLLVWEMHEEKFVLADKQRNAMAFELLKKLSTGVDQLRDQLRKARPAKPAQRLYSDYLLSVQGDTDSSASRQRRREVLRNLLFSIFNRKDEKRTFSPEQRRIIWNTAENQVCSKCGERLTWNDFTVDHIKAHAKGGKTNLNNAQLMCQSCNSRKGAQ